MTVTIYSNAAITAAYESTRYTATVNGNAAPVLQTTGVTEYPVPSFWSAAATMECGWLKFAADESVTVVITPAIGDPDITSAFVVPSTVDYTVSGGVVTLTIPAGTQCRVETNDERGQPVYISSVPPVTTPVGGTVDTWDGTQNAAVTGRTLVFPAGITDITANVSGGWSEKLLPVEDGATVFIPGNAWVIGSFDLRGSTGYTVSGHGTLSGEYETNAVVGALPTFAAKYEYSALLGDSPLDASVSGITIVNSPFYSIATAFNFHEDVLILVPYVDNSDGLKPLAELGGGNRPFTVDNCALWVGDDAVDLNYWRQNGSVTGCLISTSGSSCFLHSYTTETYAEPSYGFAITVSDCYVRPVCDYYFTAGAEPGGGIEGGAVIQCWNDGYESDERIGVYNVTYENLTVESDDTAGINCVLLWIGNRLYPWGAGTERDGHGETANWTLRHITLSHAPAELSKIRGLSADDTPFDIGFEDLVIAEQVVSTRNYATYFDINAYPYDIRFGGRPLVSAVDVCNMALGLIGNKAKVTAISPVDGSAESTHCARYYPIALRSLLEMHNWSFAQRKIELTVVNADPDDTDDPAWCYRYQIPDDWVKTISILADEAEDNYLIAGVKQPQDCEIKYSETDEEQRLYTDTEDAWLRYTFYEDDPNQWSQLFIQALAWHLAAMLAGPIIKGAEGHTEAQRCLQRMGQYLAEAKGKDSNERQATLTRKASWIAGR